MNPQLYLFYGEEGILITEAVQALRKRFEISDMNLDMLDGDPFSLESLTQAAQGSPLFLMGGKKLVVVRDCPYFKIKPKSSASDDAPDEDPSDKKNAKAERNELVEQLISLIQQVEDHVILVFTYAENSSSWRSPKKIDKRTKLYKTIQKIGTVTEFNPFSEWENDKLARWIQERVARQGKTIDASATATLIETAGRRLSLLAMEIDKLATYAGERKSITNEDVLTLASEGGRAGFALTNALRDRDASAALSALHHALLHKENEVQLLMQIASQFRQLLQIKYLTERRTPPADIAKIVEGHPFVIKLLTAASRKYTLSELKDIIRCLAEADYRLKTGQMDKTALLEMLVVDVCNGTQNSIFLEEEKEAIGV